MRGRDEEDSALARPASRKTNERPERSLPPGKRTELVGVALLIAALLLGASLLSYHPLDPSWLHETSEDREVRNFVGPVGAQLSAVAFELIGLTALLVPLMLLVAAWRKLRRHSSDQVVGRGVGALILLLGLPALLHLTFDKVPWRGGEVPAGGFVGSLISRTLEGLLSSTGSLLVVLGLVVIGAALVVQSTLGEILALWRERAWDVKDRWTLGWARRRERKGKERVRRRVMNKHLDRLVDDRPAATTPHVRRPLGPPAEAPSPPLRVTEKPGEGSFSVRRVRVPRAEPEVETVEEVESDRPRAKRRRKARTPAPAKPESTQQTAIPFPEESGYKPHLPPLNLLQLDEVKSEIEEDELVRLGEAIRSRCAEFGVEGTVEGINPGPVITVFEFRPAPGVKVSQIVNLQDDLALALKAESIRIDRLPGRSTLGIEVPNKTRAVIHLGPLLGRKEFERARSPLTMALGTTIHGEAFYADLATMPHLLVAGATGSGKSVGLQSMITSILYKASREEVQFIFIDPKRIELGSYREIPHLKAEVVVEPKKAANALRWAVAEMERRYRLLAEVHVRSIDFYNRAIKDPKVQKRLALSDTETEFLDADLKPLPFYVIVIDELADLMMVAASEVETSIARLAQMARAVGIHLIVATQRPSVDVLTGTIKANFPCRISFATATRHDSRTILDQVGSEKLLGKGDMLFMPPGTSRVMRLHGAYVSEQESAALVRWLKKQGRPELDSTVLAPPPDEGKGSAGGSGGGDDELFDEAARLVVAEQQASASFLQRRLRVGFSRAARLIDIMEQDGLLGPPQGSKPREVLVKRDYFIEIDEARKQL